MGTAGGGGAPFPTLDGHSWGGVVHPPPMEWEQLVGGVVHLPWSEGKLGVVDI